MVTGQRVGSRSAGWMLLLMLSAAGRMTTAQIAQVSKLPTAPPRVFLVDGASLVRIKNAEASDPRRQQVLQAVSSAAEKAMREGPFSVMQKTVVPPSGDKHDYMSQAPYFWADPTKPNGLPYIRHDGERNTELKKISDHDNLGRLGEDSRNLALAFYLTAHDFYGAR